jgi:hypothetical protein
MTTSPTPTGAALERIKEILRSHYPRGVNPMLNEAHDLLDAALRAPSPAALGDDDPFNEHKRLVPPTQPCPEVELRDELARCANRGWRTAELPISTAQALLTALTDMRGEVQRLGDKSDAEMLRVKACEHIALGEGDWERLRNECPSTAAVAALRDAYTNMRGERERLREALTPSAETKAAYIGEFKMRLHRRDECGDEYHEDVTLSWTVIKEIMTAISNRAALSQAQERAGKEKADG